MRSERYCAICDGPCRAGKLRWEPLLLPGESLKRPVPLWVWLAGIALAMGIEYLIVK